MAKGKKTDPEMIYKIMASFAVTNNYSQTAKDLGIPRTTVEKKVKENEDNPEFVKLCQEKKADFVENATEVINLLTEATLKKVQKILKSPKALDKTKLTELTTSLGTMYDKRALASGESTENINYILPDELKKYAK